MSNKFNVQIDRDALVDENELFALCIGVSKHTDTGLRVYQIFNKETGVIEAESSLLSNAYQYLDQLSDDLTNTIEQRTRAAKNDVVLAS